MAENRLARALDNLLAQAESLLGPGPERWLALGLKLNRHAGLAANVAAVRSAEARLRAAVTAQLPATARRQSADNAAWDFITHARNLLKIRLGNQWSEDWSPLGFPNYSLRVPQRFNARLHILSCLDQYLTAQPAHGCAELGITAARAAALHAELLAATLAINHARSERRAALLARDQAMAALRRRMRAAISELGMCIGKTDPRWLMFGLNQPAATRKRKRTVGQASAPAESELNPVGQASPRTAIELELVGRESARAEAANQAEQGNAPTETAPEKNDPVTCRSHPSTTEPVVTDSAQRLSPSTFNPPSRKRSLFAWVLPSWN